MKTLEHLWRRLQSVVAWGSTDAEVNDAGPTQTVNLRLSAIEAPPNMQVLNLVGFSSAMPKGSRVVALFSAGDRSKGVILGTVASASRRKGLLSGETTVYDLWGNEVHLSQAGVTVKHAAKVTIAAPTQVLIQCAGGVRIEGPLNCTEEVTAHCDAAITRLSQHTHPTAAPGGPSMPTPGT